MAEVGILHDSRYTNHYASGYHPENPKRLEATAEALEADRAFERVRLFEGRPATDAELLLNHSKNYIGQVDASANRDHAYLDPATYTCSQSAEVARLAAGGLVDLTEAVMKKELRAGLALVRPPGHHAEYERAAGFCLYNNIAVAARIALRDHGIERVLIMDWDLHHGNGTQWSFYDDKRVLYFSTHQYPYYPGTGALNQTGKGDGLGFTVNVPLPIGMDDEDFVQVFDHVLLPIAEQYAPELVLVSAGFDTYYNDPLGGMKVTPAGYGRLTDRLMEVAGSSADNRIILVLEGGYNLEGLAMGVTSCLHRLEAGKPRDETMTDQASGRVGKVIDQVLEVQGNYWEV